MAEEEIDYDKLCIDPDLLDVDESTRKQIKKLLKKVGRTIDAEAFARSVEELIGRDKLLEGHRKCIAAWSTVMEEASSQTPQPTQGEAQQSS